MRRIGCGRTMNQFLLWGVATGNSKRNELFHVESGRGRTHTWAAFRSFICCPYFGFTVENPFPAAVDFMRRAAFVAFGAALPLGVTQYCSSWLS